MNVLVVDDSDIVRRMIVRTLEIAGVRIGRCYEASNGQQGLRILDEEWIDLVLADINMPLMDGAEMVSRMRSEASMADVPVIIVSTDGATDRVEALTSLGVCGWVRKPFTPEQIRAAIDDVVSTWGEPAPIPLDEIFSSVCEVFAFALPDAAATSLVPAPHGTIYAARVAFSGAARGQLTLLAPLDLCREIAANVLGCEVAEEAAADGAGDALGEFANMMCGRIATAIEAHRITNISPPEVRRASEEDWNEVQHGMAHTFFVEGRPLAVALVLSCAQRAGE